MTRLCAVLLLLAVHQSASLPRVGVHRLRDATRRAFFERDGDGRQVLFRGVNVVFKDWPYYPWIERFHSNLSFVEADVKLLRALGVNLIRLGVMWPGVQPDRAGQADEGYLKSTERLIELAERHGMHTLVEPHQDEFHPVFCGEGAPDWWVLGDNKVEPVVKSFPRPVQTMPFAHSPPSREECYSHISFAYAFTEDGGRAMQRLYRESARPRAAEGSDKVEEGPYALFWQQLAQRFAGRPAVLGGELWNEPFPGDVYTDASLRDNKVADRRNLQPWYANITRAVRGASRDFLVAYEPTWPVGDQDQHPDSELTATSGFEFQGGAQASDNFFRDNVYAFHYYHEPCDVNVTRYVANRVRDAERLEAAPLATEFNLWAGDASSERNMVATFDAFEQAHLVSYTGWQYKSYSGSLPDGTCTGCGNSFFNDDGSLNVRMARAIGGRPFCNRVAGELLSVRSGEDDEPPPSSAEYRRRSLLAREGPVALEGAPAAQVRDGDLVSPSKAFLALARAQLAPHESDARGESAEGEAAFVHRFYEAAFTVSAANTAATEIGLSELWLASADDAWAAAAVQQRCTVQVEPLGDARGARSSSAPTPRYTVSVERRDAEVVVEGKVVIPASATLLVAPEVSAATPPKEDGGVRFKVSVTLEYWAARHSGLHKWSAVMK